MTTAATVSLAGVLGILGWTCWLGVRRREPDVAVNALASLGATLLPLVLDALAPVLFDGEFAVGPALPLFVGAAGVLHMLGMLGWYDDIWWWDHLTHAVSAALVAALLYAWVLVVDPSPQGPGWIDSSAAATLALTMAAGACWELLEWAARLASDRLDVERVVKRYGRFDTALDLVFDFVGAALVVALDVRVFLPTFEPIPGPTRTLLQAWIVVLAVGSLGSAAVVAYGRRAW